MTIYKPHDLTELREIAAVVKAADGGHACVQGVVYAYDALGNLVPMRASEQFPIPVIDRLKLIFFERDLEI